MQKTSLSEWLNNANKRPHVIFRGDNIEILKKLHSKFDNSVSCIYIDPPYNTGNEGDPAITVIGVDATASALEAIKAGKMTATVKQDGDAMGEANLRFALNFLMNGSWMEGLEDKYKLNEDGVSTYIPYSKITVESVGE